ncbi:TlpA family protein disulfide reductase [Rhodanobacter geophilus]|uniref:TlpA family protein disulfide reductase n=1 Tax=Rhodanobacter geophilus TaxID=3162488 RepID=A0ABV3QPU5_9GAMM
MAAVLLGLMFCVAAHAHVQPGDTPPDALGTTRDGRQLRVSSLHGKVVVVSFWATWCGYCMKEMPVLANLQSLATRRGLPLQVVAIDYREDRRTFVSTVRVLRPRLPGLLMTWDPDGTLGRPYGSDQGIPVMVMLHRDGRVAQVHVGYGEDMLDSLVAEINALLVEPAPVVAAAAAH